MGKDSVRYVNRVAVATRVFKNLQCYMKNKQDGNQIFDSLNVSLFAAFEEFGQKLLKHSARIANVLATISLLVWLPYVMKIILIIK